MSINPTAQNLPRVLKNPPRVGGGKETTKLRGERDSIDLISNPFTESLYLLNIALLPLKLFFNKRTEQIFIGAGQRRN